MTVSTVTLRVRLAEKAWAPELDEVIFCGSSRSAGNWNDQNAPTLFSEHHSRVRDIAVYDMDVKPNVAVATTMSKLGWTLKPYFTVATANLVVTEASAVVLQLLTDHNQLCTAIGKLDQGHYNEATVNGLKIFLEAVGYTGEPQMQYECKIKTRCKVSVDPKYKHAPYVGVYEEVKRTLKEEIQVGAFSPQKIDFDSQFSVVFSNACRGLRAVIKGLSGTKLLRGQSRNKEMAAYTDHLGHSHGFDAVVVTEENWNNVVMWAEISSRKNAINRNKGDKARVRRLHNWRNRRLQRYTVTDLFRPASMPREWTPKDPGSVDWATVNAIRALYDIGGAKGYKQVFVSGPGDDTVAKMVSTFTEGFLGKLGLEEGGRVSTGSMVFPTSDLGEAAISILAKAVGASVEDRPEMEMVPPPEQDGSTGVVTTSLPPVTSPRTSGRKSKRQRPREASAAQSPRSPPPLEDAGGVRFSDPSAKRARVDEVLADVDKEKGSSSSSNSFVLVALALVAALFAFR